MSSNEPAFFNAYGDQQPTAQEPTSETSTPQPQQPTRRSYRSQLIRTLQVRNQEVLNREAELANREQPPAMPTHAPTAATSAEEFTESKATQSQEVEASNTETQVAGPSTVDLLELASQLATESVIAPVGLDDQPFAVHTDTQTSVPPTDPNASRAEGSQSSAAAKEQEEKTLDRHIDLAGSGIEDRSSVVVQLEDDGLDSLASGPASLSLSEETGFDAHSAELGYNNVTTDDQLTDLANTVAPEQSKPAVASPIVESEATKSEDSIAAEPTPQPSVSQDRPIQATDTSDQIVTNGPALRVVKDSRPEVSEKESEEIEPVAQVEETSVAAPKLAEDTIATETDVPETINDETRELDSADSNMGPAASVTEPDSFRSEWEVDRFTWPEISDRLASAEREYFELAGQRLHVATKDGLNVLAVISSNPGEGCTTLSLSLARCAAAAGVRVALMDGNLANPSISSQLNVESPTAWTDLLDSDLPLSEAAVWSVEDRITLFPLIKRSCDLLDAKHASTPEIIESIGEHFQLVIIDLGAMSSLKDLAPRLGDIFRVDAAIVVNDVRKSAAGSVHRTAAQLRQAGIKSVGIAENFGQQAAATKNGSQQRKAAA